jgi:hypothetical protein
MKRHLPRPARAMKPSRTRRLAAVLLGLLAVLAGVAVPAGAARADAPLPAPAQPVATEVTTTSATFTWTAPAGPVRDYTIQVIDGGMVPWHDLATTAGTSYTHTGLTPDKVYIYRVIANPAANSGYTASDPSPPLYVTTAPLPDSVPPTKPATPLTTNVGTTFATVNTLGSTDDNRVAGYWVQREVDGVWTDWVTNNVGNLYLHGLTPDTSYTVVVVAFDPNGNRSPRSDSITFTTLATQTSPTCAVRQQVIWAGQYLLNITIQNLTVTPLSNWRLTFTLPASHSVLYAIGGTLSRSGDVATLAPPSYNTQLGAGYTLSPVIFGNRPVDSPLPSGYTLTSAANQPVTCTVS